MEHGHISPLQADVKADGVVVTVTVTVVGELDITTATVLSKRLLRIGATRPERLALDLGGLAFVDVAGARALDETYTRLQAVCPVTLRAPRPSARKVSGLTGPMDCGAPPG